jgi:hypothetical protein
MNPTVDVLVLARDASPLDPAVRAGLDAQVGVCDRRWRVIGGPHADEHHRWQTIARVRNDAKLLGRAAWVMFVDDDVVLSPDCILRLWEGLDGRPNFAALGAPFMFQSHGFGKDRHVTMGATLFRREALDAIRFRSTSGQCECQCCCDDLRALGWEIAYWPHARAHHLPDVSGVHGELLPAAPSAPAGTVQTPAIPPPRRATPARPGRLLVAFDRRHAAKFRRQFLGSLRNAGNDERVTVVAYGLYPSERQVLSQQRGVEVVSLPVNGLMPPVRRLRDFQPILARWPAETPVAYWDAGDVVFQAGLAPLWQIVAAYPRRLLAVAEPKGYPLNAAVEGWTFSILDPQARRAAFDLLSTNPFLNSGFAAGTAATMLGYFQEADRLRHSSALRGSADWGDQTALNLFCHANPDRWLQVEEGWNYCVHDRARGEIRILPNGRIAARSGTPIYVAHGNAKSLRHFELVAQFP